MTGSDVQKHPKHSVSILWGEHPDPEQEPSTYEFDTEIELKAFLAGVEAADGWLKGTVVDPDAMFLLEDDDDDDDDDWEE